MQLKIHEPIGAKYHCVLLTTHVNDTCALQILMFFYYHFVLFHWLFIKRRGVHYYL